MRPDGIRYSQVDYDRKRHGLALAAQYADTTGSLPPDRPIYRLANITMRGWKTRATPFWTAIISATPSFFPRTGTILGPAPGTPALVFGPNGMLQSGTLTQGHGSWRGSFGSLQDSIDTGSAVPGMPFINYCGAGSNCTSLRDGLYFQNESRDFDHREGTKDLSANSNGT